MPKVVSLIMMISGTVCFLGYIFIYHYKSLGKACLRALFGCAAIGAFNYLLSGLNLKIGVGINFVTAGIIGALGVPGFFLIYITAAFLNIFY